MHAAPSDFILWILNPLLRIWILLSLFRWKNVPGLWIFRAYMAFYVLADIVMLGFYLAGSTTGFYYGAWIGKTAVFLLQLSIAIQLMYVTVGGRTRRSWAAWGIGAMGVAVLFTAMSSDGWSAYSRAAQWCDVACWALVVTSMVVENSWWQWPYTAIAEGLIATLSGDMIVRAASPQHPGRVTRMILQGTLMGGLAVWIWRLSPSQRPK